LQTHYDYFHIIRLYLLLDKWKIKKWNKISIQCCIRNDLEFRQRIVIWRAVSVKMHVTYCSRETTGHWAGNGRDEISRCVAVCVRVESYCLLCSLYRVSLSLPTIAMLIVRHAEHIQFVTAGSENMYILHLQAHWICIFVFRMHRTCTLSDKISLIYHSPLHVTQKIGNILINWATTGIKEILYTGRV